MGRFLYSLPGRSHVDERALRAEGLLDRFTDNAGRFLRYTFCAVADGPHGGSAAIVAVGEDAAILHHPDPTKWIQGGTGKFHVTIEPAGHTIHHPRHAKSISVVEGDRPGPGDLERSRGRDSPDISVSLGDGNAWRIPQLRKKNAAWEIVTALPLVPTNPNPEGSGFVSPFELRIHPKHAGIDAIGARVLDSLQNGKPLPAEEAIAGAAALLAVNYRMGAEECALLGLFQGNHARELLAAAVGWFPSRVPATPQA